MSRDNIILADCEMQELDDFTKGLENSLLKKFKIKTNICNGGRNGWKNILRYFIYVIFPLKFFLNRKKYEYIIGWQQFFALFFVFYCNIFHVKKQNIVIACNFTYKKKNNIVGKIYKKLMSYIIKSKYLDYIHVPSKDYAIKCSKEFDVPLKKFIVTYFGLPDLYNKWKEAKCEYDNYFLSIGRSNRDYEFLIDIWKDMPSKDKLLIICDELKTDIKLPKNIIIRRDITGENQYKYIINCNAMIIPIKDGSICSGDTVLLKGMSFYKTVIVTIPSTLAEMYIENGVDGICLEKSKEKFKKGLIELIDNKKELYKIGHNARKTFEEKYSRYKMGIDIGRLINNSINE